MTSKLPASGNSNWQSNQQKNNYGQKCLFVLVLLLLTIPLSSQDLSGKSFHPDSKYYDFWEGQWYRVHEDGKVDTSHITFNVKKGLHPAMYEEDWQFNREDSYKFKSSAIRSWDNLNDKWMFLWLSEEGHFQIWEGRKVGDHWYIYKEFNINGEEILSRQAWIPQANDQIIRTSEWSKDKGKTWKMRFKEHYKKR